MARVGHTSKSWLVAEKGPPRQLVEVSEGRRLHGCGDRLHDDRPSPFHGHSKGSKRDGGALLPACTALLDKRRLRHGMQNDPIIAAGGTGIPGSRDEGATLIRILRARDEGVTGAGWVEQGNAAARRGTVNSDTQSGHPIPPTSVNANWGLTKHFHFLSRSYSAILYVLDNI